MHIVVPFFLIIPLWMLEVMGGILAGDAIGRCLYARGKTRHTFFMGCIGLAYVALALTHLIVSIQFLLGR